MKRGKFFLVFIVFFFSLVVAAETVEPINEDSLQGKTLEELYLMRNEIFARHGRPFKSYELFSYFMGKEWYEPDRNYSIDSLSSIEIKNSQIILKREKELLKNNYSSEGVKWGNIVNKFEWGEFTENQEEKIRSNGFVVTPAKHGQIYDVYERNDYAGRPNFITTDGILELYHLFFDFTLRKLEEEEFYKVIKNLTGEMKKLSLETYNLTGNATLKEASRRNIAFFSVPQYFLTGDAANIPAIVDSMTKPEISKCEAHGGFAPPTILNPDDDPNYEYKVDYSQFVPRGHYTRSETLKKYFMGMLWYGTYSLHINPKTEIYDTELIQALLITHHLYSNNLLPQWEIIYDMTCFYVGAADDLGPDDVKYAIEKVFGDDYSLEEFTDGNKLNEVKKILGKKFAEKTKIKQFIWGPQGAQFRFMGQRYIPDSEILQRLVVPRKRVFPKGLDAMAVFGNKLAEDLMLNKYKDSWEYFPGYPDTLSLLKEQFSKLGEKDWRVNLYFNWIWCLKSLLELSNDYDYPFFMKNEAWTAKDLSTALSSWAELRHDVILYAKSSYAAECGGGGEEKWLWIPEPPKGYIEPNVEFYRRIIELLEFTNKELTEHKLLTSYEDLFNRFTEAVVFLKGVSVKELKNEPRTLQEYEQIRRFGSLLQNLTYAVKEVNPPHDFPEGADRYIPVIADVHTGQMPGGPPSALEEGVGFAHEIYVVVEIDGKLRLMRGGVFSYYEFLQPANDRLTDEKWQQMLFDGKAPPQPDWINVFQSEEKKPQLPQPSYVPFEIKNQSGKKEPGWHKIYYDTGC
jgi:hypothetical protein